MIRCHAEAEDQDGEIHSLFGDFARLDVCRISSPSRYVMRPSRPIWAPCGSSDECVTKWPTAQPTDGNSLLLLCVGGVLANVAHKNDVKSSEFASIMMSVRPSISLFIFDNSIHSSKRVDSFVTWTVCHDMSVLWTWCLQYLYVAFQYLHLNIHFTTQCFLSSKPPFAKCHVKTSLWNHIPLNKESCFKGKRFPKTNYVLLSWVGLCACQTIAYDDI